MCVCVTGVGGGAFENLVNLVNVSIIGIRGCYDWAHGHLYLKESASFMYLMRSRGVNDRNGKMDI